LIHFYKRITIRRQGYENAASFVIKMQE